LGPTSAKAGRVPKQAALNAQKSEQKYSGFGQAASCADDTPENVFVDVNAAFERVFGYSKAGGGKTSLELGIARPDEQARTVADVQRSGSALDNETCHQILTRGRHRQCERWTGSAMRSPDL
jgi:PAS domain-containing protein